MQTEIVMINSKKSYVCLKCSKAYFTGADEILWWRQKGSLGFWSDNDVVGENNGSDVALYEISEIMEMLMMLMVRVKRGR